MKSFTLVETLVTITIFALAIGAISGLVTLAYRAQGYTWQQSLAINEARKGIETMVKEIREARPGDDGSYPIEQAADKEFVFYSDIDKDGDVERVRYFLGTAGEGTLTQKCVTFIDGGFCDVIFSDFLSGDLESAEVKVSVEGDFGWSIEYADISADGIYLGRVCQSGCSDCAGTWEGTAVFDVTEQAGDDAIQFTADASSDVNDLGSCDWEEPNHAMKANFEFSWTETLSGGETDFKKGVVNPTGFPIQYPIDQEKVTILSSYVRNVPPIFEYFDQNGEIIEDYPARLKDTKIMKVYLIIDIDPNRSPDPFELESSVQLRNLKEE
jgi:type II secretory pathway pseudopilin PulG